MNIGLIIAGGKGQRMNNEIPKQFLNVYDKPVIIYTLEAFEDHPDIDSIIVVCIDGWHEILKAYARQYNISKLQWVVSGGENGQSSIRNGIFELEKHCNPDDIVLVHDAIRPLVSSEIISNCIANCRLFDSAITTIPIAEAVLETDDKKISNKNISRDRLVREQTPQAFKFSKLLWAHKEALNRGITSSITSSSLMVELGETVHLSIGSELNIKLTTIDDIEIFKALLRSKL
jgi:2-C-methyl-D-erythritol 4-phosphate cytidylyltransferase